MSALASSWAIHLVAAAWQATVAGIVILALVRLLPATSPRLRHALVSLALVKFVIPPMLPLPTGVFSAAPAMSDVPAGGELAVALMLLHAAGILFMLARLGFEALRLRGIRRRAQSGGEAIPPVLDRQDCLSSTFLITDEVTVPMTTGTAILIPRALYISLTASELEHVLAHEREHVRRRDVRTGVLHALVAALWWFHPLVHLLVREARTLREECCDDAITARDRAGYAATLLRAASCVSGSAPVAAAAIAESPHSLLRRIRRMASEHYEPAARFGLAARVLILVTALVLLPGARMPHTSHAHQHAHHH